MEDELPFRISVAVVMVLTLSVTARFRMKAASSKESISYEAEGYLFATTLRLAGLLLMLSTVIYVVAPDLIAWAAWSMPAAIRWIAAVIGLPCCWLMYWTLSSLGKNLTNTVVTRAEAQLVVGGPYRWVRHPFYVTTALLIGSVSLISCSGLIAVGGTLVLTLLAVRTPREERKLIDKFGDEYVRYAERTGRFFPRFNTR